MRHKRAPRYWNGDGVVAFAVLMAVLIAGLGLYVLLEVLGG